MLRETYVCPSCKQILEEDAILTLDENGWQCDFCIHGDRNTVAQWFADETALIPESLLERLPYRVTEAVLERTLVTWYNSLSLDQQRVLFTDLDFLPTTQCSGVLELMECAVLEYCTTVLRRCLDVYDN